MTGKTIAFIGLGNMGGPMAANLVKAGHKVTGFDIVKSLCDDAKAAGVTIAPSAADAVKQAEVIITMLPAGQACRLGVDRGGAGRGQWRAGDRLLDGRRRKRARRARPCRQAQPAVGRCAGLGRHRRRQGRAR